MFADSDVDVRELSPLVLAYVGDAVYELFIRTRLVKSPGKVQQLHRRAVSYVQAAKQAEIVHMWEPGLTQAEKDIVRRGRNAKGNTPRHGSTLDYRYSTGMEALVGYLYLTKQEERLLELLEMINPTFD